jgi:SAM-dependent methyltransferase
LSVIKLDIVRPATISGPFVQASAEALPFGDNSFDGVGLFDVLEHLKEPDICLTEVSRVVRPGGLVLITVPAYRWLWSPHDELVGHERRYTVDGLRSDLVDAGLAVEWVSAFYGFLVLPGVVRSLLSLPSSMAVPRRAVNTALASLARRSVGRVLRRPSRWGLSLGAVALVT